MKKLATITVVAVLVVVAMAGPSAAQERAGSGRQGGEELLAASRHHHAHGHGGHHHHHHHQRHVIHGPVIHWSYPAYVPPTSYVVPVGGYWYYCPSAQAYYPHVTNCLETWVAVPAR
jgi:Ni/Co efflux regulator RcnB